MNRHLTLYQNHSQYVEPTVKPNVSYCITENEVHYNPHTWADEYFTIESLEDNNTIYLKASNSEVTKTVSTSTDNGTTWTEYTSSTSGYGTTLATLNVGEELLIKGENSTYAISASKYNQFKSTGQFKVKGNIMSLVSDNSFANADKLTQTNTFDSLFYDCTDLVSAENLVLPATTLTNNCYENMFINCTSLTATPELPATTLAQYCYQGMFVGCISLVTAPELPALLLTEHCYSSMFQSCTSLITAPELPATTLANQCYDFMFYRCSGLTEEAVTPLSFVGPSYCNAMYAGCNITTHSGKYSEYAYGSGGE